MNPKISDWIKFAADLNLKAQIDAAQASKAAQEALAAARAAVHISHDERVMLIQTAASAQSAKASLQAIAARSWAPGRWG